MSRHHWLYKGLVYVTSTGVIGIGALPFYIPLVFFSLPLSEFAVLVTAGIGMVGGLAALFLSAGAIDPSSQVLHPDEFDRFLKRIDPSVFKVVSESSSVGAIRLSVFKREVLTALNHRFLSAGRLGQSICQRSGHFLLLSTIVAIQALAVRYAVEIHSDSVFRQLGLSPTESTASAVIRTVGNVVVAFCLFTSVACFSVAARQLVEWLWSSAMVCTLDAAAFRTGVFLDDGETIRPSVARRFALMFAQSANGMPVTDGHAIEKNG